ncbi:MAG: hypothetical protein U1F43_23330 [Myxococcota bacterium]
MLPRLAPLLAIAVVGASCGDETVLYVDPDVALDGGTSGPEALTIGFTDPGPPTVFTDLATVPTLRVIHGLQGGTWTMPTFRIDGPVPAVTVTCSVTTGVEEIGVLSRKVGTHLMGDGQVEIPFLPIPIRHAPPRVTDPIDDLDGVAASIDCTVEGGGGRARATYAVTVDVQ